jgi:hypothetical protein
MGSPGGMHKPNHRFVKRETWVWRVMSKSSLGVCPGAYIALMASTKHIGESQRVEISTHPLFEIESRFNVQTPLNLSPTSKS